MVSVGRGQGAQPLGDVRRAAEAVEFDRAKSDPAVAALLAAFPEAEIKAVRKIKKSGKTGTNRGE